MNEGRRNGNERKAEGCEKKELEKYGYENEDIWEERRSVRIHAKGE